MTEDTEKLARLRSEAEFQNRRVRAGYKEPRERFYYLAQRAIEAYRNALIDVNGKRVLVVGCSEGGVTPMARRGAHVVGIDISDEAVSRLGQAIEEQGLGDRASVKLMDAEITDFPPQSFDIICCSGVLHHLDIDKAMSNWKRILRPGGRVVLLEPMAYNPAIAAYRFLTPSMRTRDEHPLVPSDFKIMSRHFRRIKVQPYVLTSLLSVLGTYLPVKKSTTGKILSLLESVDDFLFACIPPLRYMAWTALIECHGPQVEQT